MNYEQQPGSLSSYQLSAMTDFQSQKATVKCNNQHKINKFRPSSDSLSIPAASSQPGDERFGVHRANPAFSPVELVLTLILNDGPDFVTLPSTSCWLPSILFWGEGSLRFEPFLIFGLQSLVFGFGDRNSALQRKEMNRYRVGVSM